MRVQILVCGELTFWLYGFRKAAVAWEELYSGKLMESGFKRGLTCVVVFYHAETDFPLVVHGEFYFGRIWARPLVDYLEDEELV